MASALPGCPLGWAFILGGLPTSWCSCWPCTPCSCRRSLPRSRPWCLGLLVLLGPAGPPGVARVASLFEALGLGAVPGPVEAAPSGSAPVWGGVAGLFAWWLYSDTHQGALLGALMLLAMTLNLVVGALIAMAVPLALERSGRDPAIGSSVLLTFSTDSMGFLIFLGLATLLFR